MKNKFVLTTLIENHGDESRELIGEHGLSVYIETESTKILFDTGQTGAFLDNAKKMGINLDETDILVLSHGHYDHSGGVVRFFDETSACPLVVTGKGYHTRKVKQLPDGTFHFNGNAFTKDELVKATENKVKEIEEEVVEIAEGVYVISGFPMVNDYEEISKIFYLEQSSYVKDLFNDEIVIALKTETGIVVLAGCSHRGIINIVTKIEKIFDEPVCGVIGGTHLVGANDNRITETIKELKKRNLDFVAVSHCTGEENIQRLQDEFNSSFILNITGKRMEL